MASPMDWPGLHCAHALVSGVQLWGEWLDRRALYRARLIKGRRDVDATEFITRYPVNLAPLPCWQELSESEVRRRCADMVAEIERDTAATNEALRRKPLGADVVLSQDPHSQPRSSKRSPAPMVHAATKKARALFWAAYQRFVDAYRAAAEKLRQGSRDVEFPPNAFPPALPFVEDWEAVWAT